MIERISERQEARKEIEKDVAAFVKQNPRASKAEIRAAMKKRWSAKYAGESPAWLNLLLQLLPLVLKIFGIG